jgi:hypothetical protein
MTRTPDRLLADVLLGGGAGLRRTSSPVEAVSCGHFVRARRAAEVAAERYPGPVGRVLAGALLDYAEQGWAG